MVWTMTPAVILLGSTAALSLAVFALTLTRRPFSGSHIFSLIMLAVAEWSFFSCLEAASVPLSLKLLWSKLEYIGFAATPPLFLLFAAKYSTSDRWLRGKRGMWLWVPAVLVVALAATNDLHHWLWADYLPGPPGSNIYLYVHGPGYYAIAAQTYLFVLVGCGFVARAAFYDRARRNQAITVLLGSLFPLVAGVIYIAAPSLVRGLDLIPVSFCVTGLIFFAGIGYFRVFDLVPVARDALVEQMSDAFLVLDAQGRIADANAAAFRLLGLAPSAIGSDARNAIRAWPRLGLTSETPEQRHREAVLSDAPTQVVDLHVTSLRDTHNHPSGCLVVLRDVTPRYLSELELKEVNQRLAAEVHRVDALQTELREQAIRDGLTGLFNRRYLDEVLPRELERARRSGGAVCLVMMDLDHFKEVNDRLGHREGDLLLSRLGALLRERTRPSDAACRYGGEEFLIVFPGTPLGVAVARAEEIRAAFGTLVRASGYDFPVTLSVGVSAFPLHAATDDGLLRAADEALYEVKNAGRDGLRIARPVG